MTPRKYLTRTQIKRLVSSMRRRGLVASPKLPGRGKCKLILTKGNKLGVEICKDMRGRIYVDREWQSALVAHYRSNK